MKPTSKILTVSIISMLFLVPLPVASAASKEARVTQIIRDVRLLPSEAAARPAAVNDKVSEDTGVRTGGDSRSELTFPDLTITRLGSNTIFSFTGSGHTAKIESGSILLRVPKDSGGGSVKTSAVTVAVTGTTLIFESAGGTKSKLITLEGSARMALVAKPKDYRYVRAGQMLDVPAGATTLPMPVNINLNDVMKSHPLITDFKPLPSQPLIMAAAQQQQPAPQAPPPNYTGPNINIDIGGILGGGTHHNPRPPSTRPPTQPPGTHPPTTNTGPTQPPPTTGRTPGQTKNPPTTTTTNPPTKYPPKSTTTTVPRNPKGPRPKPSPTPPVVR
ncbi:MAG TPA: FecR family protein [Chthoniobacterales bacterium]|nr:FecR family protein [Chthoniobacterales bacterium]